MRNRMPPMRNVLRREQGASRNGQGTASHRYPGHEQRMADHQRRIAATPCPCGSGKPFGKCCLGKRRCRKCRHDFIAADMGAVRCPRCGSKRTGALGLREAVG